MKTQDTIAGNYYGITSPNGCTVTDELGKLKKTVEAGDQLTVQAPGAKLIVDDDEAVIIKAPFNRAALALRMLGGGVKKDLELSFIALTKQIVTDFYVTSAAAPQGMHFAFRLDSRAAGAWLNVLQWYKDEQWLKRVNLAGSKYGMPDDKFVIETRQNGLDEGSVNKFAVLGNVYEVNWLAGTRNVTINGELFTAKQWGDSASDTELNIPVSLGATGAQESFYFARYFYNNKKVIDLKPFLSAQGKPYFANLATNNKLGNDGMIAGFTLQQACKLGKHLPADGGSLTISLPTGYEQDAAVTESLDTARAKGWTLTIQTYTPEAEAASSTFGMRRVWVRRVQDEHGAYVDADGKRWSVDWCVDMVTPDDSTPDAHGYELYRSTEAAVAYWELSAWVDPEEEELLTTENL